MGTLITGIVYFFFIVVALNIVFGIFFNDG